jgi:hypothetical protein
MLLACSAGGQTESETVTSQQTASNSETYRDTLKMIKASLDSPDADDLGRLFAVGNARIPDLLAACRETDDETAATAFFTLQLLGKSDCETCPDSLWKKHTGLFFACSTSLRNSDFNRIERDLAKRIAGDGYDCGDNEEGLLIDDSLIYALVLNGSSRSRKTLSKLWVFERGCSGTDTLAGEVLERSSALIMEARARAHNLTLEPHLRSSVRTSAFFLPPEYRRDSEIKVLARTYGRILLEVSYRCGNLCGRGYYVVLRSDGNVWQYAVIRMAWIS